MRAKIRLSGERGSHAAVALADTGARMSLIDGPLADLIGVRHTGRRISFLSISGCRLMASEALIPELEVEGEALKSEAVGVVGIPESVKEMLRKNGLDDGFIVGVLTLERANMVPDVTTGTLKKVEGFIL